MFRAALAPPSFFWHPLLIEPQSGSATTKWRGSVSVCDPFFELNQRETIKRCVSPDRVVNTIDTSGKQSDFELRVRGDGDRKPKEDIR
jgi:hypothetical protein